MLDIRNSTPFPATVAPVLDQEGREAAVVAIKGTFAIRNGAATLDPSEGQATLAFGDVYHGEPGRSSLQYASDLNPPKPGTDVCLLGHAYARGPGQTQVDAGVKIGSLSKVVRVFGDRVWFKALGFWVPSEPRPFERIPLLYERAFGGKDFSHGRPEKHSQEERNPVGTGYAPRNADGFRENLPLPNLEDPRDPLVRAGDQPAPTGFGPLAPHWLPRRAYSGTYDQQWKETRFPFLPADFDARFFHVAAPGLVSPVPLAGGEPVRYVNLSPSRDVSFALPKRRFQVEARVKNKPGAYAAHLETVVIEPDADRILLTWKALIPCERDFLYLDRIVLKEAA